MLINPHVANSHCPQISAMHSEGWPQSWASIQALLSTHQGWQPPLHKAFCHAQRDLAAGPGSNTCGAANPLRIAFDCAQWGVGCRT